MVLGLIGTVRLATALFLSVAILQTGTGLFSTFLAVRMGLEGFSAVVIGVIGSAYFAGFVLGSLYCDRIVATVGHIRAFAALSALVCATTLAAGLMVDPFWWAGLRLLQGLCVAGLFLVTESWLNSEVGNDLRGRLFAVYMTVNYLALGAGQFLLNVAPPDGQTHFILAGLLYCLSLVPLALSPRSNPRAYERRQFGWRRLLAISPLGMAGSLVSGAVNGAFYSLAPVAVLALSGEVGVVSRFMGIAIVVGLLAQWPLGRASDTIDRRKILLATTLATGVIALVLAMAAVQGGLVMLVLAAAYGATAFTFYPLSVAHANDYAETEDMVPLAAGLLMAYGLGAVAGPLLAAGAMQAAGPVGLFWYVAAAAALLGLFAVWRMSRRPALPDEEKSQFMAMPRTTPAAAELAPEPEAVVVGDEEPAPEPARDDAPAAPSDHAGGTSG